MLTEWERQQRARLPAASTIKTRVDLVRRFAAFTAEVTCSDCGEPAPPVVVPDGRSDTNRVLCSRCYARPRRPCGVCGRSRRVALKATDISPDICPACYQAPEVSCAICGRRDRGRHTGIGDVPACFGCMLAVRVDTLLTGPDGSIAGTLMPLREAILATNNAQAALSNLEVLTERSADEASPADDRRGEGHECFVDVVADFPADAQAAEPVQERDRPLDHPPVNAQASAVWGAAPGDDGLDTGAPDQAAVLVVVIESPDSHAATPTIATTVAPASPSTPPACPAAQPSSASTPVPTATAPCSMTPVSSLHP
jgi:hypothetical protein